MNLTWPDTFDAPTDLAAIEQIPLSERGLPATTYDVVRRAAALWHDRIAVSTLPDASRWREHTDLTYGELSRQVVRFANLLHQVGVGRHDAVGLMSPNCQDLVAATLAAETAGIAAPVNPTLQPEHARQLLERSGARVLITAGPELDPAVWARAVELAETGAVDTVLALRPSGATQPAPELDAVDGVRVRYLVEDAADFPADVFAGTPPTASDIAAVFHTGGTTGVPKLAAHTHANEVVDAWSIAANTLLDEDSVYFAALPLFHVNALVVTLLGPLLRGQRVVWAGPDGYRDPAIYAEYWNIVQHFKIATMSAVPTVYQVLAQVPVNADISSLRFVVVGASPLPGAVRTAFEGATGIPMLEGYGLTEATCGSTRGYIDHPRPGSVGQRLPYQQVKVVRIDADGAWSDLPVGEVGVLVISGPTVFAGYVVGRDENGLVVDGLGKLVDGWLDTGDLARLDDDGFVFLTGRAKDLIIRGGHNIDPQVIEDALLSHPDVTAAGAVGRPDIRAGEVPVAYVTLAEGARVTENDLIAWAAAHVAEAAAAPKAVTVRDALPVTAVGKPYKVALRADAAANALFAAVKSVRGINGGIGLIENGSVVVEISANADVDEIALDELLGGYAVAWRMSRG